MAITSGQDDDPLGTDEPAQGYVAYELHRWARESRLMLQQLLEATEVPYAWEGTDLVAPAVFEAQIDDLVERVEATAKPALDPDADKLLYELGDWSDAQCLALVEALDGAGVAHEFDFEGNLVVLASDEEETEAVLDSVEFPDALPADDAEAPQEVDAMRGRDAQEVLSDLFIAADRLRRNARDHSGVLGAVGAGAAVAVMGLPFGFEPEVWGSVTEKTAALVSSIEDESVSDEEIEEQADQLRSLLRPLV